MQLSVPAELAQKVLQVLEKRCQGSSLHDLRGSRVYARHFLGRGTEQDGGGSPAVSPESDNCGIPGPEGTMAKAAEGELCAAPGPPQARGVAEKSDSQLFSELLEREGLFLPEVTEEQSQGNVLPHAGARCWQQRCCLHGGGLWAGHGGRAGRGCLKWGCLWVLGLGACGTPGAAGGVSAALTAPSLRPVLGSCKGLSESGSLAKIAAVVDVIQSSSSAVGLRLAGLRHILKTLEEEPKSEQQVGSAQGGLGTGSAG